jgi:hypothetical protein
MRASVIFLLLLCPWLATAQDAPLPSAISAPVFNVQGGGGVIISTEPAFPTVGVPISVVADFQEDVDAVSVSIRPMGSDQAYVELQGSADPEVDRRWRGQIPAAVVTPRGMELFVTYVQDGVTRTIPSINPAGNPLRYPTLTPSVRADVALSPRTYRMISVPFEFFPELGRTGSLAEVFGDDYGPYNRAIWRVLRWNPANETYAEADAAVSRVRAGIGFWLVTASGNDFRINSGVTPGFSIANNALLEVPVVVTLQPGWNQIGNPYFFPISWSGVEGSSLVDEPFGFDGGYLPGRTTLQPWAGYFVFNALSTPVDLRFRPPVAASAAIASRPFEERYAERFAPNDFLLRITGSSGEDRDLHTYAGVSIQAGQADFRKPPPPGESLSLRIDDAGESWGSRLRAPGDRLAWRLVVTADYPAPRPVTISMDELMAAPAGHVVSVTDEAGSPVAAPGGVFSLWLGGNRREAAFTLEFVPGETAPLAADRLAPVHPNPVRLGSEVATVQAWIAEGETATLDVLDMLGRRVARLSAAAGGNGWQAITWDGSDASGRPLPAGVYVLRLQTENVSVTRKITLVR